MWLAGLDPAQEWPALLHSGSSPILRWKRLVVIAIPRCSHCATSSSFWGMQMPIMWLLVHFWHRPTRMCHSSRNGGRVETLVFFLSDSNNLQAACCDLTANTPGLSKFPSLFPNGDGLSVTYKHDLCSRKSISADIDQRITDMCVCVVCMLCAQRQLQRAFIIYLEGRVTKRLPPYSSI